MIYVDSNIPMYLVGSEHPNKTRTISLLESFLGRRERFVTCAETLQEIVHRYSAISRRPEIQTCLDGLYSFIDEVFPVEEEDVLSAKEKVMTYPKLSARDALHVAVMQRKKLRTIFTFDRGFSSIPQFEIIPG